MANAVRIFEEEKVGVRDSSPPEKRIRLLEVSRLNGVNIAKLAAEFWAAFRYHIKQACAAKCA